MKTIVPRCMWSWPSWIVEGIGALVLFLPTLLLSPGWPAIGGFLLGQCVSLYYEIHVDANGWSWKDFGWRLAWSIKLQLARIAISAM